MGMAAKDIKTMPLKDRRGRTLTVLDDRASLLQFFRKIQEAAYDGQNGSSVYALDRLALIQALATAAVHKLEE